MSVDYTLTFTFKDPKFGLPLLETINVYFETLAVTSIKRHIQEAMLPLWLEGYTRGDPRLEEAAFGPLLLEGISFQWPWFTEHRASFKDSGEWPEEWQSFAKRASDFRLGLRAERVPLLARTLSAACYNRHAAKNHSPESVLARKGWTVTSDYNMLKPWHKEMAARVVLGDHRTYPPFFPGDRSTVVYRPKP